MAGYSRFPIVDFTGGLFLAKEAWLSAPDAFPVLQNARIDKGVIQKRAGYTLLASTGAGLPIMGIWEARYQGAPRILVLDTKRAYSYDIVADTLTDLSLANTYAGEDYDYFKFVNWNDKTYWVNGVQADGVRSWDDATDTLGTVNTAGALTIQTARDMFIFKDRWHFVSPTIGGVFYPGRIYYTDVNATTITNATQYYTYARDDVPVACKPLDMDNILILGHKGSWKVQYTGDTTTPFTCKTVDANFPCLTPHAVVEFHSPTAGRLIATLSNTHIAACDGYQWRKIDWPIRDLEQQMAMRYLYYAQGTKAGDRESVYLTYPDSDDTYPTKMLEYNVDENNWAEHALAMHCLRGISGEVNPTDYSLRAGMIARAGQGYTYGGDVNGNLFRLDYGDSDNGSNIAMEIRSAALNPYHQEGRKAYLGWIDLYADNDANASFTLYLYKDDGTTAYKTISVSCDGGGDHFWQRINVGGEAGNFHQIRMANDAQGNRPRIHALCPWFKRGGKMTQTSDASAEWPDQTWRLHYEGGAAYIERKEAGSWVKYQTWGA